MKIKTIHLIPTTLTRSILVFGLATMISSVCLGVVGKSDSKSTEEPQKEVTPSTSELLETNPQAKRLRDNIVVKNLRRKHCKKYKNQFVSHYGTVYKVENCLLRKVAADLMYDVTSKKHKIHNVESEVVAVINHGSMLTTLSNRNSRTCRQLENKYVTFKDVDVYLVQNCKRRIFADWSSYISHAKKRKKQYDVILSLSYDEFFDIKEGEPLLTHTPPNKIKSIVVEDIDVLPLAEACKGVDGKIVSYFSRLYRIKNCRKVEIDAQKHLSKSYYARTDIPELTSEQWISIPLAYSQSSKKKYHKKMSDHQVAH